MNEPTKAQQEEAADRVAFQDHQTELAARLAFAQELERVHREHNERVRRLDRREFYLKAIVAASALGFILAAYYKLLH